MFSLVVKDRVVQYQPTERVAEWWFALLEPEFITENECLLRRPDGGGECLRRPDESFSPLRRAPECPTSRYCPECPCG